MQIIHTQIKVRDLFKGYIDDTQTGRVSGFDGKLDIRPAYQREFVYKDKQRDAVINTIRKGFPLNVIYWAKKEDGTFEVLDGQQRTISICQYCNDEFSIDYRFFHNLTEDEKNKILDYELDVYQCEGSDSEKLEWFKTINIAGEKLLDQELRNAVYAGSWLSDAKKKFSARNCAAERSAKDYLTGAAIRQAYLEKALSWIADKNHTTIEEYMAVHQHDNNANELWLYFNNVIEWVKSTFSKYYKEMASVEWGILFNKYGETSYDTHQLEAEVIKLMEDDDVTAKKGIFEYLLSGKTVEKVLSIRAFTQTMKRTVYTKQNGICPICKKHYEISEMEGDHITPWCEGGKTSIDNLQMLCKSCNRQKSNK